MGDLIYLTFELENIEISSFLQPIFSLKTSSVVGFEALCRGFKSGEIIYPLELFSKAKKFGKISELEFGCRLSAFYHFDKVKLGNKILFLNLGTEFLEDENHIDTLLNLSDKYKISPKNICLEILESKINDTKKLIKFIKTARYYGYMIAIDDFGQGDSNYERLCYIKPDIIKIDISLIRDIQLNPVKKAVVKHIASLGHSFGALILAEGIEQDQELFSCMDVDVDMFQGFLLSKPKSIDDIELSTLDIHFKTFINTNIINNIQKHINYKNKLSIFKSIFNKIKNDTLDEITFKKYIEKYDFVQAIYLLGEDGKAMFDTIYQRNHIKPLFKPAKKGENLSFKDYFIFPKYLKDNIYITNPYISQINGKFCITISGTINQYILCVDFSI